MADLDGMSTKLNYCGLFGPIDEDGIVPDAWKVPQPEAGITIYEPTAFLQGVRNQVPSDSVAAVRMINSYGVEPASVSVIARHHGADNRIFFEGDEY